LNPDQLNGKKIAVFIGACFSETEKASFYVASVRTGFGILGCNKSMFANRISYWLNLKGPSMAIDEACCSSSGALAQAYQALTRGDCEAAIVGGANLFLHPQSSIHTGRIVANCPDGKTRSFDDNANGCAKSEAIQVVFLQKAKDAFRVYGELVHIKNDYIGVKGSGTEHGFHRDPVALSNYLKSFYDEVSVPPEAVEYVEAMGAAIPDADKTELESIDNVFCKNRRNPLLVGSVLSNIGYTEASTGLCSLIKVLLAFQTGKIPANLHCSNPRSDVPALQDGRIHIVTENKPFQRGYVGINNHSITGCTAHMLVAGRYKPKDYARYKSSIPHLLTVSGRHENAVQKLFDDLKSRPVDPEELALLHNIHSTNISGHLGRGFIILDTDAEQKTVSLTEQVEYFDNARRPLWFVYSGMGSQWAGMGTKLMRIPTFAAAIERCQRALEPKGVDLVHIITSTDKKIFDNILHSFVGIAAIQIGLTDILRELGLVPDKIIGHSVGELGCAYADGCFTAEEMILSAYSRGLVSVQTPFIRGSMAAVGIGYKEVKDMLPPEIEVACHNSAESSTISGPADVMREFVTDLSAKGIFAKEVPCSNIAYHSRYIAEAGPGLLKYLTEVIKEPKQRSDRWVSTSVPIDKWNEPEAKTSSAQYHTNNLLNAVLFEETATLIPANAVLVEIAPHGLLQAILKRSLPVSCKHIPLTRRGHPDNALMLLEGIGKLFMEGYHPKVQALYPKIEYPVSTGTPMLSHLVEWAHNEKWPLPFYVAAHRKIAAAATYIVCLHDPEFSYLSGHVVKGKNVYPYAAALVAVWDTLAMSKHKPRKSLSVAFSDVQFYAQPVLNDIRPLKISVAIHRGQGRFEVMEGNSKIVTGYINEDLNDRVINSLETTEENMIYNSNDIYQILYDREYTYGGIFRSIYAVNESLTKAKLLYNNNWVTLIDGMLQMNILRRKHDTFSRPLGIRKMYISTKEHSLALTTDSNGKVILTAEVDEILNKTSCAGITMESFKFNDLAHSNADQAVIRSLQFIPHFNLSPSDIKTSVDICLQIVSENVNRKVLSIIEILTGSKRSTVSANIGRIDLPDLEIDLRQLSTEELSREKLANADLILVENLSMDDNMCELLYSVTRKNVFILSIEQSSQDVVRVRPSNVYRIVASQNAGDIKLNLLKWRPTSSSSTTALTIRNESDLGMLSSTRNCLPPNHKLLVLSSYPPVPGVKDLVEKWRKESILNDVYLVMVKCSKSEDENQVELPELDLAVNILDEGIWGGEYYLPLEDKTSVSPYITLRSKCIGDLDSLSWVEMPEPEPRGIPVTVHYAGLNSVDSMKTMGTGGVKKGDIENISYGMDFSGVTNSGARVMGLVESGAASTLVMARPELLWPVPKHWTLEDAATVPAAYALAFYCLAIKVPMQRNQSILVHGGAGALGQAVISIALAQGLQVFATVSDIRKKHFLKKLFPELKEDYIGNSRDATFGDMVQIHTKGKGVLYVINCIKGDLKDISLRITAENGSAFDTTQIQNDDKYSFKMQHLSFCKHCYWIDFSTIVREKSAVTLKLQCLVSEGIRQGYVRPLSRVTYAPLDAPRAFRLLRASQHRGRVLLSLQHLPRPQPRIICSQKRTHLLICDDQSFGTEVADKLVKRGATKLFLQLPTSSAQVLYKKGSWKNVGVDAKISTSELKDKNDVYDVLMNGNNMGVVEGIYFIKTRPHSSTDQEVLNNLDEISRKVCPSLRYFAVVTPDKNFGTKTCIIRAVKNLPATKVSLPSLKKIYEATGGCSKDTISSWLACDALEQALRSKETITLAQIKRCNNNSLLHKIATISDNNVPENIGDDVTLEDLGVSIEKVPAIDVLLCEEYNLSLSEEDILHLSVKKIREVEQTLKGRELKETKGLEMFFSYFDSDELSSTTQIMLLPTLANDAMMRNDDFDVTKSYLCIIPGMEGHYEQFRDVCERVKISSLVLQPGLDVHNESIKQMAARYAQTLMKMIALKDSFYLLGYESGVMVALETAAIFEKHGLSGTIYLIGTSPGQFRTLLETELQNYQDDESLRTACLKHMYKLICGEDLTLEFNETTEPYFAI
ncbi:hypothetical protein evm_002015, partial [Chilo suppressalis]